jgi:hypothetical protein
MRLRVLAVLAAVIAAAATSVANAKGPAEGRLCGSSGCVQLRGYEPVRPFLSWWDEPFAERRAPRPAPFFRVVLHQAGPDAREAVTWTLVYVPSRNAMRITQSRVPPYRAGVGPYWRPIPVTARVALRRATAGARPYPASVAWRGGG